MLFPRISCVACSRQISIHFSFHNSEGAGAPRMMQLAAECLPIHLRLGARWDAAEDAEDAEDADSTRNQTNARRGGAAPTVLPSNDPL